ADAARQKEAGKLATEVKALLAGPRPAKSKPPDGALYDNLVSVGGALLQGLDLSRHGKPRAGLGLAKSKFGKHPGTGKPAEEASLVVAANTVTEVRLPAALFLGRELVVEGKLDAAADDRAVHFQALTAPPGPSASWDGKSPVVASPTGAGYKQFRKGLA